MPAKSKTTAKKKTTAKVSSLQSKRPARSSSGLAKAGSKRKGSPSPAPPAKRGVGAKRGASESEVSGPSRQATRGRSASRQKEEPKARGGSKTSHVTRAAVEEVETKKAASRGRSKTPSTPNSKKVTPQTSRQSKIKAQSPKQKKATPKQKAATPRQRSATPKSRATTPKQKAVTPKSKPGPQKKNPKAKNTPKQSAKVNKKTTAKTTKKSPQGKQELPKRGSSKSRKTDQESETVTKSSVSEKKSSPRKTPTKQETPPKQASRSPRKGKGDEEADSDKKDEEQEHTDEASEKELSQAATTEQPSEVKIDKEEKKEDVEDADSDIKEKEAVEEDKDEEVEEDEIEAMETEEGINEDENVEQDQVVDEEADQPEVVNSAENNELGKAEQPEEAKLVENDEPEATEEQEEEVQPSKSDLNEEKEAELDSTEKHSNDSVEKDTEEDITESQAESEQVESDDKECESAESEQVEADTPLQATNVAEPEPIIINEDSGDVSNPEIISDGSEDSGEKVIEVNEDSDSAVIILDSKEVGGGDQAEQGNNASKAFDTKETSSSCTEKDTESGVEIIEEAMENDVPSSSEQVGNGLDKEDDSEAKKRKIDEVEEVEDIGESSKKAKISVSENSLENGTVSKEEESIDDEFVVIEMSDVPPIDSSEVQESIPKESVTNINDKDSNPVFNRDFVPNPAFSGPGDISKQFSVVSYNILADCHLFRNDYSFTENKFLVPEYRLEKIIEELKYLDGDIICMQEVDPAFFSEKLLPGLQSIGYEGFHKKRTEEYFNEGEATFYKTGRFTIVECQLHRQADLIEKVLSEGSVDQVVQDAIRKYVDMPDVLVVTKLRCNNTGAEVTVGNVHINWGEMKTPDIQCVQIASAIKETVTKAGSDNVPHIICGDFNSPPLSPGYLVARDGYPSGDDTITKLQQVMGLQLPEEKTDSLVNCLWPAFQHTSSSLKSAYSEVQGKEPEITSYNQIMCECVDYIFYSSTSIDNVGVYKVPSKDKLMETGGTPNLYFPSDHVSVKALLSFK